jgi:hypothetical protein
MFVTLARRAAGFAVLAVLAAGCGSAAPGHPAAAAKPAAAVHSPAPKPTTHSPSPEPVMVHHHRHHHHHARHIQAVVTTPPAPPAPPAPSMNPIPQGNGGDQDADNNCGPSDGDGDT